VSVRQGKGTIIAKTAVTGGLSLLDVVFKCFLHYHAMSLSPELTFIFEAWMFCVKPM